MTILDYDETMKVLKKFKIGVVNLLNDQRFKTAVSIVNGISEISVSIDEKKGPWNVLKVISQSVLKLHDYITFYPFEYFNHEWMEFMSYDMGDLIYSIIDKYPFDDIKGEDSSECFVRVHDFEGCKVGYLKHSTSNHGTVRELFVFREHAERAKELISKKLWDMFEGKHVLLTKKTTNSERIIFRVDETIVALTSEFAMKKVEYFKRCIDANLSRSMLLYGPPGTGKSTIAKTIIHNLGLRSFRINLQDLNKNICASTINEAIKIFKPDALIIDDMDRSNNQDELLAAIEEFHHKFKLIIVTANDLDRFDDAMLRPERFDEIEFIDTLDEAVVKNLLGEKNMDLFEEVKGWPISFINEIKNRRLVMNKDEIKVSLVELAKRIEKLSKYKIDDDDDDCVADCGNPVDNSELGDRNDDD